MASPRPPRNRRRPDADINARVPYEPLRRYCAFRMGYPAASLDWHMSEDGAFTTGILARWLGVKANIVGVWRRNDSLRVYEADRVACSMKVHPFAVWGDDWLTAGIEAMAVDVERIEAAEQLELVGVA